MTERAILLAVRELNVSLGESAIVHGVSLDVRAGGITALLGRNGAGKTTLLRGMLGLVPRTGSVRLDGEELASLPAYEVVRRGIGYVPENRDVFGSLTVAENLRLAERPGATPRYAAVYELFPELRERAAQRAGTLSGGQQQMVAIARGLMAKPEMLLLDEPSLGLSPLLRQQLAEKIKEIHNEGVTLVLVEQNARLGLMLASYGYVLENGELALQGNTSDLMLDENVKKAYLGV